MTKIRLHQDYVIKYPSIIGNQPLYDEVAVDYMWNLTSWGNPRKTVGDLLEVDLQYTKLDMQDFSYIMTRVGGDVINFKPYIGVADMDSNVPNYLPNAYKTVVLDDSDPENLVTEKRLKTWLEWVKPNYSRTEINGVTWFLSYAGTDKAVALTGETLWNLETAVSGVDVEVTLPEVEETIL